MASGPDQKILLNYIKGYCTASEKNFVETWLATDANAVKKMDQLRLLFSDKLELSSQARVQNDQRALEILRHEIMCNQKENFEAVALAVFRLQAEYNSVYKSYLQHLNVDISKIKKIEDIPFLPIELYKNYDVKTFSWIEELNFLSSGTTGSVRSKHPVKNINFYLQNSEYCFREFYPDSEEIEVIGLLPGYISNPQSSLIHMVDHLAQRYNKIFKAEYLFNDFDALSQNLEWALRTQGRKIILFGVSFALMNFAQEYKFSDDRITIIETGGMKSFKKEFDKSEILKSLQESFPVSKIYSEYGMTELLSQFYAMDGIHYLGSARIQARVRSVEDPFGPFIVNRKGRLNIIDLANLDSCSFIETADLGTYYTNGTFSVEGRLSNEMLRGCNLMWEQNI